MVDIYREEILEHWRNPQNFGEIADADVVIEQVNPLCGDEVTFYFKLSKIKPIYSPSESGDSRRNREVTAKTTINSSKGKFSPPLPDRTIISDVSFTGSGCAISIASASILSENIKGKSASALSKIAGEDVLKMIGGAVAPARLKCAFLALEAVKKIR